jgi:hypothetical protein
VIYTFFTLLTNTLGGERDIIISTSGRSPKSHLFPFNYCCPKVDISDPYTFLAIKRGILQYTWIKPILCLIEIILETNGSLHQNKIGLKSGYMWVGITYNISISISLYSLALFWYLLLEDLEPYRPLPKFLCIKSVIFFSYWQGFLLAILVWLGIIPESSSSSGSNNIARAIQNSLMCVEMVFFAVGNWYAFSYQDYATTSLIGFARMPVYYAIRDAFGIVDLMIDFKSTFWGNSYGYRQLDSVETVLAHPQSRSTRARIAEGLRYRNGGRSKYWLPKSSLSSLGRAKLDVEAMNPFSDNPCTHLLGKDRTSVASYGTGSPMSNPRSSQSLDDTIPETSNRRQSIQSITLDEYGMSQEEFQQDELLYSQARRLKYGDYNYPVITVRESVPYTPIIDQLKAHNIPTTIQQEYDEFAAPGDDDSDGDFIL